MKNLSVFQIVLIAVLVVAAIAGVAIFATGFGTSRSEELPPVTIWGVLPERYVLPVIENLKREDDRFSQIIYEEKDDRTYVTDFVDALASGSGPDLFLLPENQILELKDKIVTIPFDTYSARTFRNTFVEAGELYLTSDGMLALPFVIDPMVMYWNRDIFNDKGIANPPAYWDEFFTLSPKITERDRSSSIEKSFVAFGEYRNINHAKDILSALILQTGNPIVSGVAGGELASTLTQRYDYAELPAVAALRFYTEFADPVKSVYSWNRSLPNSRQAFLAGDLAVYMGFASEYDDIVAANPNLNFDIASFPRSRDASRSVTIAHVGGLAIARGSSNTNAAFAVALALTEAPYISELSTLTGLPPVRRDLLEDIPTDTIQPVFYTSAIVAKGWLDPDPAATEEIYQDMIESTLSGLLRINEAVGEAQAQLDNLLK